MVTDTATEMAQDAIDAIEDKDGRQKEWSKTYDVRLFGQKYTVSMMVKMTLVNIPIVGQVRLGTDVSMVMLANTDEVRKHTFNYTTSETELADSIRREVSMGHSAWMAGNTKSSIEQIGRE